MPDWLKNDWPEVIAIAILVVGAGLLLFLMIYGIVTAFWQ